MTKSPSGGKPREFWLGINREGNVVEWAHTKDEIDFAGSVKIFKEALFREVTEQDKAEGEFDEKAAYQASDDLYKDVPYPSRDYFVRGARWQFNQMRSPTPASPGEVRVTAEDWEKMLWHLIHEEHQEVMQIFERIDEANCGNK